MTSQEPVGEPTDLATLADEYRLAIAQRRAIEAEFKAWKQQATAIQDRFRLADQAVTDARDLLLAAARGDAVH